jgi:hypothetical protein
MKVALVLAVSCLLPLQDDEAVRKAKAVDRAIEWLLNVDPEVREMGRKDLRSLGKEAVPAIERKLAEKGSMDLVQMLRELDRTPAGEIWVPEKDLKELEADEQFQKELRGFDKTASEKYVHVKYAEALAQVRKKNYQRAFDMASGLLALEPRSANSEAVKRLRRHCENMITQTTLIEAKILQPKVWYLDGEAVELTARMKNLYRNAMTLTWEKGAGAEAGAGMLILDVEITMSEIGSASMTDQRHPEFRFEEEIPIAPGAQWERKFTVDTSTAIADATQIRIATVGGWSQPAKIATDGVNITRRIQFEPATVKILPRKYEKYLENPLEALKKSIEAGEHHDAFIASQILDGPQRDQGIEVLIQLLDRSTTPGGKNKAAQILTAMTGQSHGADARRWQAWFQGRSPDKESKKK